ncbi:MAG: glycosyltransferase [Candidatus Promineifilaceae bacterium]|nr:glycosyltransferase [Candidatus Promineifilaceae bacterium]
MYGNLMEAAAGYDVLINYNGVNIHPQFLEYLPTFNVFCCFDDPESSVSLSAPVAASYDAVFYGNIAARFQYESWKCKQLAWLPNFSATSEVPRYAESAKLVKAERDIDIVFVGAKTIWRKRRLESLASAFPQAQCYGRGWDSGYIDDVDLHELYQQAKIGWNVHNSSGPINRRLFALPAFGVLQICDNKTGLGQIFKLNEEVVGFDTIPEAIELTRYYLAHEAERLEIVMNAFHRFWQDYHTEAIWQRIHRQLLDWGVKNQAQEIQTRSLPSRKVVKDLLVPNIRRARRTSGQVIRFLCHSSKRFRSRRTVRVIDERAYLGEKVEAYHENPALPGVNMAKERIASGNPLDWPNILALNWAVTSLIGPAKRIIEIGSGTGPFAQFASVDPERSIDCFEEDDFARNKAIEIRSRDNVRYFKDLNEHLANQYDLLVSVEVIEHVAQLRPFLNTCIKLAPRAIFTTPNRLIVRGKNDIGPPTYAPHVRDFAPGEIYWVLKLFYRLVYLYHMPDVYVPWLEPMTIAANGTPIIAECFNPL